VQRPILEEFDDLARLVRREREECLRALGLSSARYAILRALSDRPESSGSELAQKSAVRYQTMDEALEGLERAGLLERPGPVGPGYARRVRLTRAGTVLVERCRAALLEIEHLMLQRFSTEQVDLLQQFLEECAAQLRRAPRPAPGPPASRPAPFRRR